MRTLAILTLTLSSIALADAPDDVRKQLARGFAKKDVAAIDKLVVDPYSGLRWCSGWDDAAWKRTAHDLEHGKLVESKLQDRVYDTGKRHFEVVEINGLWKLDLNSLLGPFPHM